MWRSLVVAVRLPVFVLGLAALLLGATLMSGYTVLRVSINILTFPLVVLGAVFSNKPQLIGEHFSGNIRALFEEWKSLVDVGGTLVKWGIASVA